MTRLYIRNHPDEITQPWWDRFEQSLVSREIGTKGHEQHIKDRREKLDAAGAVLQYEKETGLPYLKFQDEQSMCWFVLKWS
jgi:hypothetical protein